MWKFSALFFCCVIACITNIAAGPNADADIKFTYPHSIHHHSRFPPDCVFWDILGNLLYVSCNGARGFFVHIIAVILFPIINRNSYFPTVVLSMCFVFIRSLRFFSLSRYCKNHCPSDIHNPAEFFVDGWLYLISKGRYPVPVFSILHICLFISSHSVF